MPACSTACFGLAEVRGITVYHKYHVACMIGDDGVLVCGCIVKEKFAAFHRFFCRFGLGRCNGIQGSEHGGVDGTSVIEENTDDFLNEFLLLRGKFP